MADNIKEVSVDTNALSEEQIVNKLEHEILIATALDRQYIGGIGVATVQGVLDLVSQYKQEAERLEYVLLGVMHSVDKWLDGKDLEQDEVNRASAMREKTLQLVEQKQAEIDRLTKRNFELAEKGEKVVIAYKTAKVDAVKEYTDNLKSFLNIDHGETEIISFEDIDNLANKMESDSE